MESRDGSTWREQIKETYIVKRRDGNTYRNRVRRTLSEYQLDGSISISIRMPATHG
jgi:hypothetical protein